ncbi:uncharacterized protein PITG_16512 [Phytophthora infestans T30-4]|uniref:Uncharacterized protein n=1 Tax=Phytophthora infestans (strain T30-4) TaxID=403677 RepID=D0NTT8_PHYIT|nr:uncharacterized protein PITG_16512 [Phytophthora infestans T30-4]EEY65050.1 conserved hypothetical protein [Phytophthora infestans T30-4]|eukprot:XP_002897538.1 conserved hypothetical protein [Phytophthora infestans T30-4]
MVAAKGQSMSHWTAAERVWSAAATVALVVGERALGTSGTTAVSECGAAAGETNHRGLVLRGGEPGARVLDNGGLEILEDMIVVVDGQTRATWPIRSKSDANILPESIDQCKDYSAFAVLLGSLNVDQPDGGDGSDLGSGVSARDKMSRSLAVSKVVLNAKEIEFDGLAKDGAISIYATRQARPRHDQAASTIAQALNVTGPLTTGILRACIDYVGVKAPLFSLTRLHGAGPSMGVELGSTGEMARFGTGMHEAHLTRPCASFRMPKDMVLISIGNQDIKREFAEGARILQELVSM